MLKNMLVLKYGLLIFAFIALYFLLMKLMNLEHISELRLLNIVFVIYFTIRMAKELRANKGGLDYLQGLFSLFLANILAVAFSVFALSVYFVVFPEFKNEFKNWIFLGEPSITEIIIAVLFEGSAASIVVSFSVMQYYKKETIP